MTPTNLAATTGTGLEEWLAAIDRRTARVGIIGLGYVGLPLALLFSEERFRVTGFDVDATKVSTLTAGNSYIHRIESDHIQAAQRNGFCATVQILLRLPVWMPC